MALIFDHGDGLACWLYRGEFYLYGVAAGGGAIVLPSEGMARAYAAAGRDGR